MDNHLLRYNKDKVICFMDFETANLNLSFSHNLVWQSSFLKVKGNEIIDEMDLFIKWDNGIKVSDEAARITHYDQYKIDRIGIKPESAFNQFYPWLEETDLIIGHNILNFDTFLLKEFCLLFNRPYKPFLPKFIDTVCIARGLKSGMPYNPNSCSFIEWQYKMSSFYVKGQKNSLSALAKEYNIPLDESRLHDGLYDLKINKQVWDKLKFEIEI